MRPTGAYWGAAGEQIDLLSGNLNFTVPLIQAMGRGGWSVTFALSYNSQMWRQDSGGIWLLGEDSGYGLGWKLQAGSILPVWYNGSVLYYVYSDSTGAQYVLDQNNGNVWSSLQGVYVFFDANADILHFPDGSFWNMSVISASVEQDAGTLYPSMIEDSNGNQIVVSYKPAAGYGYQYTNTSSRIASISDSRCQGLSNNWCFGGGGNYGFTYNSDSIPHLTGISNSLGTPEYYSFSIATQYLTEPFGGTQFGSNPVTTLTGATVTKVYGPPLASNLFQYDSSGEMTQFTTPLGGQLNWGYGTYDYANRNYREVWTRSMLATPGGTTYQWGIQRGSSPNWHTYASLADYGAGTEKCWGFSTLSDYTAGLATIYEEFGTSGAVLLEKDYTWEQTSAGSPFVGTLVSKLNPGASYAASTTTVQVQDNYGNLTQSQVTDYANSTTGTRTYNFAYLNGSSYAALYIFNRMTSATATPSGGSPVTLTSTAYDGSCGGMGLTPTNATNSHDPAYGTTAWYRGNPTTVSGLNSADTVCTAYDTAGVPYYSADASGHSVSIQTNSDSSYSLPGVVTPGGNGNLGTSASYASSWAVVSMTGPNNAQGTTTYDAYGRPSQTQIPDGAVTAYAYTCLLYTSRCV